MSAYAPPRQSGIVLLEGLIAILIFSLGILAVVGLQAVAVKQVSDARYRSDAALLANQLLGTMWVGDRSTTNLQTNFNSPQGAGYLAWLGSAGSSGTVAGTLPGVTTTTNPPTVVVDGAGTVTVTLYWHAPSDNQTTQASGTPANLHRYVAIAQIK